jgi:hypothetical protein
MKEILRDLQCGKNKTLYKNKEWYYWLHNCGDTERSANNVTPVQEDKTPESWAWYKIIT